MREFTDKEGFTDWMYELITHIPTEYLPPALIVSDDSYEAVFLLNPKQLKTRTPMFMFGKGILIYSNYQWEVKKESER